MSLGHKDAVQLLAKHDRPVPRYTSYPPANHFHPGVGACEHGNALEQLEPGAKLSLYVHVPFCEHRCTYCACFVVPTRRRSIAEEYLEHVTLEAKQAAARLGEKARVAAVHVGGGTPTYLDPGQLEILFDALRRSFPVEGTAEVSVEIDPRVTTPDHLDALRRCGVNRVSLGVQDTSDEVQRAIGRLQSRDETVRFYELCRERGFESINIDLVYGLPHQTRQRFERTLTDVFDLRPERLSIFGYAHVPSMRPNQRAIDAASLPGPEERLDLWALAHETATARGYEHIGLDHFAFPQDDLVRARKEGRLSRSFMGYTPHGDLKVVGLGVSSVSDLGRGYFQNLKKLSEYFERLERGELPVERGWLLSEDDVRRRHVIHEILCALRVDAEAFKARFGASFEASFPSELERLADFQRDGHVRISSQGLEVEPQGRVLLRNIASVFDAYLQRGEQAPIYSRAV